MGGLWSASCDGSRYTSCNARRYSRPGLKDVGDVVAVAAGADVAGEDALVLVAGGGGDLGGVMAVAGGLGGVPGAQRVAGELAGVKPAARARF